MVTVVLERQSKLGGNLLNFFYKNLFIKLLDIGDTIGGFLMLLVVDRTKRW